MGIKSALSALQNLLFGKRAPPGPKARPNKPVMFAVVHERDYVTPQVIGLFRDSIQGKKTLFIEMGHYPGPGVSNRDFMALANVAHGAGLEIVPLDRYEGHGLREPPNIPKLHTPQFEAKYRYENLDKREKQWEAMLKGATSKDIIVMHPEHAKAMVGRLGIPQSNIAYFGESDLPDYSAQRQIAMQERLRIEAERRRRKLLKMQKAGKPGAIRKF